MAMTLDKNGQLVPLEEKLTEQEKREKEYVVNVSTPLVVERGSYTSGAKVDVNPPYAIMNTPIRINISCIRGYEVDHVDICTDETDGGRYLKDDEYTTQDDGVRTKLVSFIMPMADVNINIILKKENE